MVSQYELNKQANIQKNKELLAALGLEKPLFEPQAKMVKRAPKGKKRKTPEPEDSYAEESEPEEEKEPKSQPTKAQKVEGDGGVRRSSRISGKVIDYKKEIVKGSPVPVSYSSGVKVATNEGPMGREEGVRKHDPKTYGHIPGIAVGTWWATRMGCSVDAVHAPPVGGISGGSQGAYSIALSGGYEDDVDLGYAFTYTGSGGRALSGTKEAPKNLRTAPQSSDQSFENPYNRMLLRSSETRKPVRVIRGFKASSRYAPFEGYRYDGLYVVEKAWMEKGTNAKGYLVCRYALKRLPGQPPIPVRDAASSDVAQPEDGDKQDIGDASAEGADDEEENRD
ncbi:hypothetical protein D9613_001819 [Agrocybe pediades]|uniref:YDG domain-containing protein n=1 Tax=Agrocybe pediades TaxID=84607 RepID=A0A8H4VXB9_9AGAR|nr:hypothetical protein D9613_001819 [Agrocybe pediades]